MPNIDYINYFQEVVMLLNREWLYKAIYYHFSS
jgi:hypothetical protein